MKIEKSLQEVRDWKQQATREFEGLSPREITAKLEKTASDFEKKYGLTLRKLSAAAAD